MTSLQLAMNELDMIFSRTNWLKARWQLRYHNPHGDYSTKLMDFRFRQSEVVEWRIEVRHGGAALRI